MTVNEGELAAERIRLGILRRTLGEHLATYRRAAGVSQPELSRAMDRTRTTVSKVEHGTRGMPEASWRIADEVCGADGALLAEYQALAEAEQDYRERWRAHQRQERQAAAQPAADALRAAPVPSLMARGLSSERCNSIVLFYWRPADSRPSKVISKAFKAAFHRLDQRCCPVPVGSRLMTAR